jgi:hypothetical protein
MSEFKNRVALTFIIVISFLLTVHAISLAMHHHAQVSSEWKEILLLVLGALIGTFTKVIDYWFSNPPKPPCPPPPTPPTNNEPSNNETK